MRIAVLEPDIVALDHALEVLSSAGHFPFGALCDKTLRVLLAEVSVDLVILDWANPDALRYDTLRVLCGHEPAIPVILCAMSHTQQHVINAGLMSGANVCLEKPIGGARSLAHIHALGLIGRSFLPQSCSAQPAYQH